MGHPDGRYVRTWRAKWTTDNATTIGEMIDMLLAAARQLDEMRVAGVQLESPVEDDYAYFYTHDRFIAEQFGFYQEGADDG